jgi:hypothetical protein
MDQMNIDLTYSVCFNLAAQYEANEMYSEVSMCICVCVCLPFHHTCVCVCVRARVSL